VSISLLKLPKNVNVPLKPIKDKNNPKKVSIRQIYPYKLFETYDIVLWMASLSLSPHENPIPLLWKEEGMCEFLLIS
jgi:hypothetical protein